MNHFVYIFAAYSASTIGLVGLCVVILWRHRSLTKKIALLEKIGKKQ